MQLDRKVAVAASLGAMLSVQGGAAFAKHLFPLVGPDGASLLRIGLAALAGLFWAFYILATSHVTKVLRAQDAVSAGMSVAALLVLPFVGCTGELARIASDALLPGLGVAVFSSAIPFTLELVALKGLPAKTFSIILSLEPAVAAQIGFVALNEVLRPIQLVAMACVIVASAGSTLTATSRTA